MTPEDFERAGDLFEQLQGMDEHELPAALDAACKGDEVLRREVLRLLDADRRADANAFLNRRALEDAALLIEDPQREVPSAGRLTPGERLGHYEIVERIGAGGMGEVYRAHDSQLHRDVAIKVLPGAIAGDAQYMARFEHEATILASLNHPNIATIYGVERGALVMELVEGDTLRGPVPIEEAIPIARQIAAGLEAAHERGVVHRDLKPANIKITPGGIVKLLDFGLAKSASFARSGPISSPTASPTASPDLTQTGTVVGSAAYMSPEQAMAKPADKRADIWAFGVVFYELLTGERLFPGETVAETLAAVVRDTPDFSKLPADVPPYIRRLLQRCVWKDRKTRLRDIGEARVWLDDPHVWDGAPPPRRNPAAWLFAAVMTVAAVVFAGLWLSPPARENRRLQFSVAPPAGTVLSGVSLPAVSPNGRYLAFVAESAGRPQLWIRDLEALNARAIPGSDSAADPFWSPDSRFVAFFVPGKLKKVSAAAGPLVAICDAADGRGGSWGKGDVILFAPTFASPLLRVSAKGGTPAAVTTLDQSGGETSHRFPWFLPDGRHFLFTIRNASPEKTAVYVGDLDSTQQRLLLPAASNAAYTPGFVLYMRGKALLAQRFAERTQILSGDAFPIAEPVDYLAGSIQGQFSVSQTGVLAFDIGGGALQSQATWMGRDGKPLGTLGPPGVMQEAAISPAGDRAVLDRLDPSVGTYDLWLYDLTRNLESRFTFDPGNDMYPVWSQDGSSILFSSDRGGRFGIYRKPSTGAQKEDLLYQSAGVSQPTDASSRYLLFALTAVSTGNDLWGLPLFGSRQAAAILQSKFAESHGRLSPDGRWLAYDSDESGVPEIYVQSFPGAESKWQVSAAGGTRPVWRRDGAELYYVSQDNRIMSVAVNSGSAFDHGAPQPLFRVRMPPQGLYDVSHDGRRFLILDGIEPEVKAGVTVVVNWNVGVKR
ncbi:MAG TPA: protein kinase [Bryobacteraceae bacterium]|jgi:Tol biopolymer transport system component|nr:protein kinase [Bryobacteraceae bacterium]